MLLDLLLEHNMLLLHVMLQVNYYCNKDPETHLKKTTNKNNKSNRCTWTHGRKKSSHVFALHLLLAELDLNEWLHCGEELPPWPVLHAAVLVDVLLDAADRQILNLKTQMKDSSQKTGQHNRNRRVKGIVQVI